MLPIARTLFNMSGPVKGRQPHERPYQPPERTLFGSIHLSLNFMKPGVYRQQAPLSSSYTMLYCREPKQPHHSSNLRGGNSPSQSQSGGRELLNVVVRVQIKVFLTLQSKNCGRVKQAGGTQASYRSDTVFSIIPTTTKNPE